MTIPTNKELRLAALVHASPLLGIPVWIVQVNLPENNWNFPLLFALGLFMFAAGTVASLLALTAVKGFVRTHALKSLRFHGWIGLVVVLFAVSLAVGFIFDPPNPTMSNPPVMATGIFFFGSFFSAFILPLLELGRAVVWGRRAWRGVSAEPNIDRVPEQ